MGTGIYDNGQGTVIEGNFIAGFDKAIELGPNSSGGRVVRNTLLDKATLAIGPSFIDLVKAVHESNNPEAIKALEEVKKDPHNSVNAWIKLVRFFGPRVGSFNFDITKNILGSAAWEKLKEFLSQNPPTLQ